MFPTCTTSFDAQDLLQTVQVGTTRRNIAPETAQRLRGLGVDLDDPLELASLIVSAPPITEALNRGWLERPIKPDTRARYLGHSEVFLLWCRTRTPTIDPLGCSVDQRAAYVAAFFHWLTTTAQPTDPAIGMERGQRRKTAGLHGKTLGHYRLALEWWAEQQALPNPCSSALDDLIVTETRQSPSRKAVPVGLADLKKLVQQTRKGPIQCGWSTTGMPGRPADFGDELSTLWAAEKTASILVHYWGAFRIANVNQLRDDWCTASHGKLDITVPHPKAGRPEHIALLPHPDHEICPIRALANWLTIADSQSIDRQGYLLPRVTLHGAVAPQRRNSYRIEDFQRIFMSAGLGASVDPDHHFIGTHGLRRGRATEAYRRTGDLEAVRRLLRHASISSTERYVDRSMLASPDWAKELGL